MNRLCILLILLLLTSCSCKYEKADLMNYFSEIQQLNNILIKEEIKLGWSNHPDSISSEIIATRDLIKLLKNRLNLTEIENYKIDGESNSIGLAYRFGNPKLDKCYSFLIFAENEASLKRFASYEQFTECSVKSGINSNWAYSIISPNCNN